MEFISKNILPENWNSWFSVNGARTFDYLHAQNNRANLEEVRNYLLNEQNYLCAYCQKKITTSDSSIEHVIAKSLNIALSTDYYNLVAVCKSQKNDPITNRLHCDKEKENKEITPFVFFNKSKVEINKNNSYFDVESNGLIKPKDNLTTELYNQVKSFIEILNLNHSALVENRKNKLFALIKSLKSNSEVVKWENIFNYIYHNHSLEYKQFLLIYFAKRKGLN